MAANQQFADYASTALAQDITSGQTTFNVATSVLFPAVSGSQYFYATLVDLASTIGNVAPPAKREVVKVTAIVGTLWTVVRGVGGAASAFSNGDVVDLRLTAQALADIQGNAGGFVLAENFAGADIGAKINTALASLSSGTVYVQTAGTISTAVTVPANKRVQFGPGAWTVSAAITLTANGGLIGVPGATTLNGSAQQVVRIAGNSVRVRGFTFDMTAASAGSSAILFRTSLGSIGNARLHELNFTNCYSAIADELHATNLLADIMVTDVLSSLQKGLQIYVSRSAGYIHFKNVIINQATAAGTIAFGGALFEHFGGVILDNFDVAGGGVSHGDEPLGYGIKCDTGAAVWMNRVFADTVNGDGITIVTANYVFGHEIESSLSYGTGIHIASCNYVNIDQATVVGAAATGGPATRHGLWIDTCTKVNVSNVLAQSCTGDGIRNTASTDVSITNIKAYSNTGRGLLEEGAANTSIYSNARLVGNTAGSLTLAGANSAIVSFIPNSGTFTASQVGAGSVA